MSAFSWYCWPIDLPSLRCSLQLPIPLWVVAGWCWLWQDPIFGTLGWTKFGETTLFRILMSMSSAYMGTQWMWLVALGKHRSDPSPCSWKPLVVLFPRHVDSVVDAGALADTASVMGGWNDAWLEWLCEIPCMSSSNVLLVSLAAGNGDEGM